MKLKDIAKIGIKGRKKDALLISLVIILSFIFIITSTIFQSSKEKTQKEQAFDLYGQWHGAYLGADATTSNRLKNEENIDKIGTSLIVGKSDEAGVIGSFNQDLLDIGRLSLYKGEYPTRDDEIMVELNQMSQMGLDLEVGQKIRIEIVIPWKLDIKENFIKRSEELKEEGIMPLSEYSIIMASINKYADLLGEDEELLGEDGEVLNEDDVLSYLNENYSELEELGTRIPEVLVKGYDRQLKDYRMILDKEAGDSREFLSMLEEVKDFKTEFGRFFYQGYFDLRKSYLHREVPSEDIGDINIISNNSYLHFYEKGTDTDPSPETMREKGVLVEQNVKLRKEFTVVGILESYSDKWDLADHPVANSFITEEAAGLFSDAMYNNSIVDFSEYEMKENIFLFSNLFKSNIYEKIKDKYPNTNEYIEEYFTYEFIYHHMYYYMGEDRDTIEDIIKRVRENNENQTWDVRRSDSEGKDKSLEGIWDSVEEMSIDNSNFRKNTLAYGHSEGSAESILNFVIIGIIFIATALAIFQIFLTQMKRRSRKLVLLKSIGATKGQIISIILHEGLYFLRNGLLIGVPVGLLASIALVYGMNTFGGRNLQFFIEPKFLILGIIAGIVSLFVGMIVPMIFAVRIPLTGTMSKPPKHKKVKGQNKHNKIKYQSFSRINWEYLKLNRGKSLIGFGISFITITILLSTIFLCYSSFNSYKANVLETDRPDYAMEMIVGEPLRQINIKQKELMEIDGVESVEVYKVGKQLLFWNEGIENNQILNDFTELLPMELRKNHFMRYDENIMSTDFEPYIKDAFLTKIYGIHPDGKLFHKYRNAISDGSIDSKRFESGEEVILLLPMYVKGNDIGDTIEFSKGEILERTNEDNRMSWIFENSGAYKQSFNERYKKHYERQDYIKPGDTIYLSSDKEDVNEAGAVYSFTTKKVKVGGIIHYFPQGGDWPFSNSKANYTIISSIKGMESIYPQAGRGLRNMEYNQMKEVMEVLYPTRYGRTLWYINTNSTKEDVIFDSEILAYAHHNNYTVYNYKSSNAKLFQEGFNNALIIGMLGITAAAIAFIILYNIMVSKIEQDKNRIGILQALGVTREQFSRHYIKQGIINGFMAILLTNILLFCTIILTSSRELSMTLGQRIKDVFVYGLWLYPWNIHLAASILFFVLTVLIYYLPSRKIIKNSPVENIRSLSR